MKLPQNAFLKSIRSHEKQIGLWLSLASPLAAEVVAPADFDWVMIDMEHSPNDYFSIMGQLQVFDACRTVPIVRPQWNDPVVVKRLLDLGTPGLLFPMINTVEEARKAVASTRYPPAGVRGIAASTRATKFGRITDYIERIDDETAVVLQIESMKGLDNALDIAKVDGVDGIFFGPGDIAADIGKAGQPADPSVWAHIQPVAQQLIELGIPVGTLLSDAEMAAELLKSGYSFVACGADTSLLAKSTDAVLAAVKNNL